MQPLPVHGGENVQIRVCCGNVRYRHFPQGQGIHDISLSTSKICSTQTEIWRVENVCHVGQECICAQSRLGHGTNATVLGHESKRDGSDSALFGIGMATTISQKFIASIMEEDET